MTVLVLAFFLWGCQATRAQSVKTGPPLFDRHEVVTGVAKRQTVLTGFLLEGPMADLVVLQVDGEGRRHLRLYACDDGTWVMRIDATLDDAVRFVDVANIDGRDRLLTYAPGRLSWFDPDTTKEHELVAVTSSFPLRWNEISHVDITRDLNDDGRDDLVIPDADGFHVLLQEGDGRFAASLMIGPPTDLSRITGADGYRYDPWTESRIHEIDYDHDGRGDLVFWNEDHFEVHTRDVHGRFDPNPVTFTTDVAFDTDKISFLATGDSQGTALHSVTDLNGDGIGDLVLQSLTGARPARKRSAYELHFGRRSPGGGTTFSSEADATLRSRGRVHLRMDRHDLDGDGLTDLLLTTIDRRSLEGDLWKELKGFMGDDVGLYLEFYRNVDGRFPNEPDTTRIIALDGVPSHREPGWVPLTLVLQGPTYADQQPRKRWNRIFNPTLLVGDVTGDGRSDLIKADHPRIMEVSPGVSAPDLFMRTPRRLRVDPPNDEEYTWLVDLNRDGKQDILMHHPFTLRDGHGARLRPPGTEPQRVTMLIAR